jgi:hypothetical protein
MAVRKQEAQNLAIANGAHDRFGIVRRINDDHLRSIADDPDVVLQNDALGRQTGTSGPEKAGRHHALNLR